MCHATIWKNLRLCEVWTCRWVSTSSRRPSTPATGGRPTVADTTPRLSRLSWVSCLLSAVCCLLSAITTITHNMISSSSSIDARIEMLTHHSLQRHKPFSKRNSFVNYKKANSFLVTVLTCSFVIQSNPQARIVKSKNAPNCFFFLIVHSFIT